MTPLSPAAAARPRMLVVLAHPDDEAFGMGGTLALYSWCGAHSHLVCTTNGDLGTVDPAFVARYGSVVACRTAELHCAADKLGLAGVTMLGYRDSGMAGSADNQHPDALAAAPLEQVAAQITQTIRAQRPHVVVTFDPAGGYRHPDHIATYQATVRAFEAASDAAQFPGELPPYQPQKLYYVVFPRRVLRLFVALMPLFGKDPTRFGRNQDVNLAQIVQDEFPVHARISYSPVEAQRAAAVACHASQNTHPTLSQSLIGTLGRRLARGETFMRAYPPAEVGLHERDLFAGVDFAQ